MWWARLLAGATYLILVGFVWLNAGATAGLLIAFLVGFLTVCMRLIDAGDVITDWARFLYRKRPAPSSS